jgi:hypothetical protein
LGVILTVSSISNTTLSGGSSSAGQWIIFPMLMKASFPHHPLGAHVVQGIGNLDLGRASSAT